MSWDGRVIPEEEQQYPDYRSIIDCYKNVNEENTTMQCNTCFTFKAYELFGIELVILSLSIQFS